MPTITSELYLPRPDGYGEAGRTNGAGGKSKENKSTGLSMSDFSAALLAEYQHDLTRLTKRIQKRKAKSADAISLLARYGQAAWLLGDQQADLTAHAEAAIKSVESLAILIDSGAPYDDEWHERLWLAGYGAIKTLARYRDLLWGAALRLFNGGRDKNFLVSFTRSIDKQLTEAWEVGAKSVGVERDEMDEADRAILDEIQRNEFDFVHRLAGEIDNDRAAGMELEKFTSKYGTRVDMWARRYTDTVNQARIYFGGKERLIWTLGVTEKHCPFCKAYNGIVAYAQEWQQARVQPQAPPNSALTGERNGEKGCQGWFCDCTLKPTTKRRSPRALNSLIGIHP